MPHTLSEVQLVLPILKHNISINAVVDVSQLVPAASFCDLSGSPSLCFLYVYIYLNSIGSKNFKSMSLSVIT